jgi:hypothetical protein
MSTTVMIGIDRIRIFFVFFIEIKVSLLVLSDGTANIGRGRAALKLTDGSRV